jgi:hypothetical protein
MPRTPNDFEIIAAYQTPRTLAAALAERGIKLQPVRQPDCKDQAMMEAQ